MPGHTQITKAATNIRQNLNNLMQGIGSSRQAALSSRQVLTSGILTDREQGKGPLGLGFLGSFGILKPPEAEKPPADEEAPPTALESTPAGIRIIVG